MLLAFLFAFLWMTSSSVQAEDARSQITAMLKEQDEAWNRGDLKGFVKPYDDSGQLIFVGSKGIVRSPQVLKEHYEQRYKEGQGDFGRLSFSDLEVEELGRGLARAWGRWLVEQKDKKVSGWFTLILKETPTGWRIIHDH